VSSGSVTAWFDQLCAGDRDATQPLWQCFYKRMVSLARQKLRGAPRGVADEEDVALSAFDSFCRGAEQGRFPKLSDRDDIWRVLFVITERKAIDLVNHEKAKKRGKGQVRHEGSVAGDSSAAAAFDNIAARELTPEEAAQVAEQCCRLLDLLGKKTLQEIAVAKMEGATNEEIAKRIKRTISTVERKLMIIRTIWGKELAQ
jgi:DNA-directed RNA polymerase specialized sigma24 family protein